MPSADSGLHAAFISAGQTTISQSFDATSMRAALASSGHTTRRDHRPQQPSAGLCAALTALITVDDAVYVQALVPLLYLSASLLLSNSAVNDDGDDVDDDDASRNEHRRQRRRRPGVRVTVRSEGLPIAAGLGSSAAVSVSAAAAMLRASGVIGSGTLVDHASSRRRRLSRPDLELINEWAFASEKIFHGTPSGVDNAVSTFGGMVQFRKGDVPQVGFKASGSAVD